MLHTYKALNNETSSSCRSPPVSNHPSRALSAQNAVLLVVPVMDWASSVFFFCNLFLSQTHFPYLELYSKLFFLKWPMGAEGCSDFVFTCDCCETLPLLVVLSPFYHINMYFLIRLLVFFLFLVRSYSLQTRF